MQIKITGRGLEITNALRDYAQAKVSKLEEFFNNIQKVEVILEAKSIDNSNRSQVAEIRAWLAGHKVIQATEGEKDMYAAIDVVVEEAKRQIKRHKEKHSTEQRRKAEKLKHERQHAPIEVEKAEPGLVLVKVNSFSKKPMSLAEAQDELKLLAQDFLAFRNSENDQINVIRKSQNEFELLSAEREMLPEEAVEELKKTDTMLLLFNNKATSIPSIVYRRKAGNFGLIEP